MTNPLVTIMIPTYNQDKYIGTAVESALSQTYKNKEIIILDDCSNDKTETVLQKYKDNQEIRYIKNNRNIGRVGNYRQGLYEYSKGEWVINLDGDDFFIDDTFIETAISLVELDQDIVLISADRIEVNSFEEIDRSKCTQSNNCKSEIVDGNKVFMGIPGKKYQIYHLTSLYNRNTALKINFYSKDIISSDFESLYRLILGKKVVFIDTKVAAWRIHGKNESRTMNILKLITNYEIFNSVYKYALEQPYLNPCKRWKWFVDASAKKYYTNIISLVKSKNYKELWILSKFIILNFPFAFVKTLLTPKLYFKLIKSKL